MPERLFENAIVILRYCPDLDYLTVVPFRAEYRRSQPQEIESDSTIETVAYLADSVVMY